MLEVLLIAGVVDGVPHILVNELWFQRTQVAVQRVFVIGVVAASAIAHVGGKFVRGERVVQLVNHGLVDHGESVPRLAMDYAGKCCIRELKNSAIQTPPLPSPVME
ncbi:MAG: hypothetical protein QOC82_2016 [Frankiaceae bacterium]|nr:hypothetical protein [Frankiaceae bacterium]